MTARKFRVATRRIMGMPGRRLRMSTPSTLPVMIEGVTAFVVAMIMKASMKMRPILTAIRIRS
ncbi:MAG TPA: hypothetical protein PKD54_15920 [Pirellulaceae bacterium]|nr:hypothetical protein [Pirellulaceae bacterium]